MTESKARSPFQELDETLHTKARLGIMTLLAAGQTDFSSLRSRLGLTDGNLGAHIRVLEDAGYIQVSKSFVGRKPRTICRMTASGRHAFRRYLKQLGEVIRYAGTQNSS